MNNKEDFIESFRKPKLHGNFILDLNPFTKLNLCFAFMIAAGLFGAYWTRLAAIVLCFVIAGAAGKTALVKFTKIYAAVGPLLFFFLVVLNSAFREGQTVYWEWWIIGITKEGFFYGLSLSLLILEICGLILLFYNVTPPKDLMYSVEMLGVSHSASYILLASMQGITDLGKMAHTIMESQSARGVEVKGSLKTRFKAFVPVLAPLLLGSIAATEEKTVAMETRAFASTAKATHVYELRKAPAFEKILCIALDLALIAAVVWRFLL